MTNSPPSAKSLNQSVNNMSNNNGTCGKLKDKSGCTSLGSCVWAVATDKKTKINKCVAAVQLGSGSKAATGSDGPSDICYCSKDGKLIPWEEYYYLDGGNRNTNFKYWDAASQMNAAIGHTPPELSKLNQKMEKQLYKALKMKFGNADEIIGVL